MKLRMFILGAGLTTLALACGESRFSGDAATGIGQPEGGDVDGEPDATVPATTGTPEEQAQPPGPGGGEQDPESSPTIADGADSAAPGSDGSSGDDGQLDHPDPTQGGDDRFGVAFGGVDDIVRFIDDLADTWIKRWRNDTIEDDHGVTFGSESRVFHIGDDAFEASSCKARIRSYPISGPSYDFAFEVIEDRTNVRVSINRICGVDYGDPTHAEPKYAAITNFAYLLDSAGTPLASREILVSDETIVFPEVVLDRGSYHVLVESRMNELGRDDRDDFVFGPIRVESDKLRVIKGGDTTIKGPIKG